MGIKFSNNASSNITHALTAATTSISITPGTGDRFPSIVEGKDYFYATLAGNNGLEIVKVTKRVLDTMTVERAQDGTSAITFNQGDLFELRIVAADFEDTLSHVETMLEDTVDDINSSVDNKMSSYLPLSGGTMTGEINFNRYNARNIASVELTPPADSNIGGFIDFHYGGNEAEDYTSRIIETARGHIEINAPNGLGLDGKNILTSDGGAVNGALQFPAGLLIPNVTSTIKEFLCMADGSGKPGAFLSLHQNDCPDSPGSFGLFTRNMDGSHGPTLFATRDGALTWNGLSVLTSAGGEFYSRIYFKDLTNILGTQASNVWHAGATDFLDKNGTRVALIQPMLHTDGNSTLHFAAYGTTNAADLVLSSTGALTLNSRNVVFSVNGNNADIVGNVAIPTVPTGSVIAFAANSEPSGFILCNGAAVSRTTYASLFSVIGTTYGTGNGSTTFNLPLLTDRFIQGSGTAGTVREAGLPNITGTLGTYGANAKVSGAVYLASSDGDGFNPVGRYYNAFLDASLSSAVYGNNTTVQPPALTMRYYIKY